MEELPRESVTYDFGLEMKYVCYARRRYLILCHHGVSLGGMKTQPKTDVDDSLINKLQSKSQSQPWNFFARTCISSKDFVIFPFLELVASFFFLNTVFPFCHLSRYCPTSSMFIKKSRNFGIAYRRLFSIRDRISETPCFNEELALSSKFELLPVI